MIGIMGLGVTIILLHFTLVIHILRRIEKKIDKFPQITEKEERND